MIAITKDMMIDAYASREGINELIQEIASLKSERQEFRDWVANRMWGIRRLIRFSNKQPDKTRKIKIKSGKRGRPKMKISVMDRYDLTVELHYLRNVAKQLRRGE